MLSELALSPAIFRTTSYESSLVADLCLQSLKTPLLEDCVVRNLYSGEWFQQLSKQSESLHPKAKELLKKLKSQSRMVVQETREGDCPVNDEQWECHALDSHYRDPLSGMIFSREAKQSRYPKDPLVACPERISSSDFWKSRPCSVRISRSIEEYRQLLRPVLRHSNWIAFMDPHLNPDEGRYEKFIQLLINHSLTDRKSKPVVEIHRVAWLGDSRNKSPRCEKIEEIFRKKWTDDLKRSGIKIEVFMWDDFHDRFVASSLLGMSWSNGFDTTTNPNVRVTVSHLSRADRDDLQEEFAQNSTRHTLVDKFAVG